MALVTKAIKGTQDLLPADSYKTRYVEQTMLDIASKFGYKEIRTPVFEHTELFSRGVGDTTDVVQKEMYTFDDKGGRSITLRPEGTAGAMRAFLEHGLFNEPLPQKVSYLTSCYRYEKPQAGRLREFHQFGVECLGTAAPAADAELIALGHNIFSHLGIEDLQLEINSIGCPECRKKYHEALHTYFESKKDELCETCLDRLGRNPMRILDCKSPVCSGIAKDAPKVLDYICEDCAAHFETVKSHLDAMNIPYVVNPTIVRGLDYYTRTVFEFVSTQIGAQGTVCGGGRYDGLAEQLGGNSTPSLGFALGIERLMLLMQAQNTALPEEQRPDLYIASMGDAANVVAAKLAASLREEGISVQYDVAGRSVKAQMKYANKLNVRNTVVIGDSEIESGKVTVKDMDGGESVEMELDGFEDSYQNYLIQSAVAEIAGVEGIDMSGINIAGLF
ncbi:MAG: histidine--tRNA ligase [Clostridia bacterium]|nr:histidine--tRNA ligase [Clostridia bacterium]